jgi:hypothetical protein
MSSKRSPENATHEGRSDVIYRETGGRCKVQGARCETRRVCLSLTAISVGSVPFGGRVVTCIRAGTRLMDEEFLCDWYILNDPVALYPLCVNS